MVFELAISGWLNGRFICVIDLDFGYRRVSGFANINVYINVRRWRQGENGAENIGAEKGKIRTRVAPVLWFLRLRDFTRRRSLFLTLTSEDDVRWKWRRKYRRRKGKMRTRVAPVLWFFTTARFYEAPIIIANINVRRWRPVKNGAEILTRNDHN